MDGGIPGAHDPAAGKEHQQCAVQRDTAQGHPLDREHLAGELGDVAWYLAEAATALGMPLEDILRANLEKLERRYPDGFSTERSVGREADDR